MLKRLFALVILMSLSFTTAACLPFSFDVDVNESSRSSDFDDDDKENSATGESRTDGYITTMHGHDIYIRDDGNLIIECNQIYLGNVTARDASVSNGKVLVGVFEIYIDSDDRINIFSVPDPITTRTFDFPVDSCTIMNGLTMEDDE